MVIMGPIPALPVPQSVNLGMIKANNSVFPIPDFLLKITLGESATLSLDGRQVLPNRLLVAGYQFQYKQLDQLLPELI